MFSELDNNKRNVNPLATRYVAPGRLPWIGTGEAALDHLVEKFHRLNRCCQILGPHGSGKSTLLEHLIPRLGSPIIRIDVQGQMACDGDKSSDDSSAIWWFKLRRGSAVMQQFDAFWKRRKFSGTLVIDGGEQLSWWRRQRLRGWARKRECGLLVTSHTDLRLDTLLLTQITPELARQVVRLAFREARGESELPSKIEQIDWESWLIHHRGNLRECLMDLYDQVETMMREAK